MYCYKKFALVTFLEALLLLPAPGRAQSQPAPGPIRNFPVFTDLSVIGSDGIYYWVTPIFPILSNSPPTPGQYPNPFLSTSKLEGFNLDPNFRDPFEVLEFSGLATHLAIGKDNRLYLIVSSVENPLVLGSKDSSWPQTSSKSKLYIIPTPFPKQEAGTASTDLTDVVQVELEGVATSLKIKDVADQEYLYIVTTSFGGPLPLNSDSGSLAAGTTGRPIPVGNLAKLLILDSNGKRIKEADLD